MHSKSRHKFVLNPSVSPLQSWTVGGDESLEAKCGQCGCLFETQDMLKIHVQETHSFAQGEPHQHFLPHSLANVTTPQVSYHFILTFPFTHAGW